MWFIKPVEYHCLLELERGIFAIFFLFFLLREFERAIFCVFCFPTADYLLVQTHTHTHTHRIRSRYMSRYRRCCTRLSLSTVSSSLYYVCMYCTRASESSFQFFFLLHFKLPNHYHHSTMSKVNRTKILEWHNMYVLYLYEQKTK